MMARGGSHVGPCRFFSNLHPQENSRPLTANAILLPALSRQVEWTCLLVGNRFVWRRHSHHALSWFNPPLFVPLSLKDFWLSHRFLLHNCNIEISNHIQADIALFFDPSFDSMDPTSQFRVLCSVPLNSQCCGEIRVLYLQPTSTNHKLLSPQKWVTYISEAAWISSSPTLQLNSTTLLPCRALPLTTRSGNTLLCLEASWQIQTWSRVLERVDSETNKKLQIPSMWQTRTMNRMLTYSQNLKDEPFKDNLDRCLLLLLLLLLLLHFPLSSLFIVGWHLSRNARPWKRRMRSNDTKATATRERTWPACLWRNWYSMLSIICWCLMQTVIEIVWFSVFFDGLTWHTKSWKLGDNFQPLPEGAPPPLVEASWWRSRWSPWMTSMLKSRVIWASRVHLQLWRDFMNWRSRWQWRPMSPVTRTIWRNRMGRVGEAGVEEDAEASSLIQILATVGEIQRVWTGQTGLPDYLGFWKSEN